MPHILFNPPPTNGWSEPVQTHINKETKEKLISLSNKENRSISSIIRDAIESYLSVAEVIRRLKEGDRD